MDNANLLLFAPDASRPFAERIAQRLGIPISPHEERSFEDGEHKIRPLVNVRERDVYVVQSLYADHQMSVNDKLVRLLFFLGALRDAGAGRITAVAPLLCYARKDRKTQPRDPVTTRYVAGLFEAVGVDCIMTLDVHNLAAFQNAFRCETVHLEAVSLFVEHFASLAAETETTVVSPDAGGIKRADVFRRRLAARTGRPVGAAFAEKYRAQGVVSGDALVGDVAGKVAIIFDDLIGTGTTVVRAAHQCLDQGARRVHVAATHGLFVGSADATLAETSLDAIVVTDSVPPFRLLPGGAPRSKLSLLDTGALFAEAIGRLHSGGSIAELLAPS